MKATTSVGTSEFILYSYFRSSAAFRVRMAFAYLNTPFEYRAIHLLKDGGGQNSETYRAINPMGEIPCLVHQTSAGQTPFALGQSMAILLYLDGYHKRAGNRSGAGTSSAIFPDDPQAFARVIQMCEDVNSGIHPIQNLKVLQHLGETFGADKDQKNEWGKYWIERGFTAIEKRLAQTAGICSYGDSVTAADFFLIGQIFNARRFQVAMEKFPRIEKLEKHFILQPWVKAASPDQQPDFN